MNCKNKILLNLTSEVSDFASGCCWKSRQVKIIASGKIPWRYEGSQGSEWEVNILPARDATDAGFLKRVIGGKFSCWLFWERWCLECNGMFRSPFPPTHPPYFPPSLSGNKHASVYSQRRQWTNHYKIPPQTSQQESPDHVHRRILWDSAYYYS